MATWPPVTEAYAANLKASGKVFIPQLPGNTNLGASAAGFAGGRDQPPAGTKATYELAPGDVQQEMGNPDVVNWYLDTGTPTSPIVGAIESMAEGLGLDHGVSGVAAKLLGIPVWVFTLVLFVVAWAVLENFGLVPSIKKTLT